MDSEERFLLQLCRIVSGKTGNSPLPEIDLIFDEGKLFQVCFYHQILPFVHHFRETISSMFTKLSSEFFEKVKHYTVYNTARLMAYLSFLEEFDKKLKENHVDYIVIKGIANAFKLYEKPELRSFGDLDILILPDSLEIVQNILLNDGFKLEEGSYTLFPERIIRKYSFARHYIRQVSTELAVDIHLNLSGKFHPFQFNFSEFWENSTEFKANGMSIKTFSNEYFAVYLFYHAFKHYYFRLDWIIDAFYAFDTMNFDAGCVEKLIVRTNLTRIWSMFLNISNQLFGRIPKAAHHPNLEKYYTDKSHRIINCDSVLKGILPYSVSVARIILPLFYLPSFFSKVRFLLIQFFPPKETVEIFYTDRGMKPSTSNYLKLRIKAFRENFKEILNLSRRN